VQASLETTFLRPFKKVNLRATDFIGQCYMRVVIQNSYCKVEGDIPLVAEALITECLTYQNDIEAEKGNCFYRMKQAKRFGNHKMVAMIQAQIRKLEATEWVCLYKDRSFPSGLLNIVLACLEELKVPFEKQDLRECPGTNQILRWNNKPFEPRYYQHDMINLGLAAGRGVMVSAVGTGKSLIMAYLIKNIAVNSLVIVPSRGLSGQLYNDFCSWFGSGNVELLDAAKIRKMKSPKAISIVTVQSLGSLKKSGEFKDFVKKIDAIYCDELHHAGAATYTKLLEDMDHIYYRYGFTGTFLRNDNKTLDMWSFLSNVLYEYPAWQAIQEGFLTPMEAHIYSLPGKANKKYQTEYDNNYCANKIMLDKIMDIVTSVPEGSQILILVSKKDKGGLVIHEYLKQFGISNAYISGDNKREEINNTISAFNDKQIKVLIGSSVIGEGIDVRSTDHLIMCQGGKSEITMVQAIGRAIRLFDGKLMAFIHDFRFEGTNYMIKHVDDRIDAYLRNFQCKVFEHG
jgi:superfamily II DNA or RNA helicase